MINYKPLVLSLFLTLASCGGIPTRKFRITAIDDDRQPVKCLIVIDDQWPENKDAAIYTPADVTVAFAHGTDSPVHIMVKPAKSIDEGVLDPPKDTDRTYWLPKERDLRFTHPRKHLFIMVRDLRN